MLLTFKNNLTNIVKENEMKKGLILIMLGLFFILMLTSCFENDYPPSIYDKNDEGLPSPIIDDVFPKEKVYGGVTDITIIGENFSADAGQCFVYFDGHKADILSQSETQFIVRAPIIQGDSLTVKVSKLGAYAFGEYYPYKIEFAAIEYGGISNLSNAYGIAGDTLENIYVSSGLNTIMKITPDGEKTDDWVPVTDGAYVAMKMGPGGHLYAARTKYIYIVPPEGGSIEKFTTDKLSQPVNDFDFDQYGNIFVASKKIIFCVKSDASNVSAASFPDIILNTIRVFNDYVYTAGYYTGYDTTIIVQRGIWRNQILDSEGNLGETELVYNWGMFVGDAGPQITAITFDEDGVLYIGAESGNAITMLYPNADGNYIEGATEILFPAVLTPPATNFCWGTDQYLYVNRKSNVEKEQKLIKITTGKMSAPYYGRR